MAKKLEELSKEELVELLQSANKKIKHQEKIIKKKSTSLRQVEASTYQLLVKLDSLKQSALELKFQHRMAVFSSEVLGHRLSANGIDKMLMIPERLMADINTCPFESIDILAQQFELQRPGFRHPILEHMTPFELAQGLGAAHYKIKKLKTKLKRKAIVIKELEQDINTEVVPTVEHLKGELMHTLAHVDKLQKKLVYHRLELPYHRPFSLDAHVEGDHILQNLRTHIVECEEGMHKILGADHFGNLRSYAEKC